MTIRRAACACGALTATCEGEPVRISVCHCLECQRRTGSVFGVQARFARDRVTTTGLARVFERGSDDGGRARFHFCPSCGSTVFYELESVPGYVGVPVGAFADPEFPAPNVSVYEARRHPWTRDPGVPHERIA